MRLDKQRSSRDARACVETREDDVVPSSARWCFCPLSPLTHAQLCDKACAPSSARTGLSAREILETIPDEVNVRYSEVTSAAGARRGCTPVVTSRHAMLPVRCGAWGRRALAQSSHPNEGGEARSLSRRQPSITHARAGPRAPLARTIRGLALARVRACLHERPRPGAPQRARFPGAHGRIRARTLCAPRALPRCARRAGSRPRWGPAGCGRSASTVWKPSGRGLRTPSHACAREGLAGGGKREIGVGSAAVPGPPCGASQPLDHPLARGGVRRRAGAP